MFYLHKYSINVNFSLNIKLYHDIKNSIILFLSTYVYQMSLFDINFKLDIPH